MRGLLLLLLVLAGARCTHAPSAPLTAAAPARWPEPQPPALRLPDTVRPVHYTLDLTLLPAEPTYSGTVTVDLDVGEATQQVWLHAEGLTLTHARVRSGERVLEARTVDGGEGRLGVLLPEPLAAGKAQLSLGFTGHADRVRSQGLYAVEEGGEPALYTFFEPTDARRAFPCFDEPGFKVPWRLRFTVKQEHVALANHALVSEELLAGGLKRVTFADSRPMPSYLVAFMVGPFDVVDAGRVGRTQVPLRFINPAGRAQAWRFFQAHFELLAGRMRSDEANGLLSDLGAFCDDAWRAEAEAWLTPRAARIEGGPLTVRRVLESVRLCAESNRRQLPGVVEFLR